MKTADFDHKKVQALHLEELDGVALDSQSRLMNQ